MWWWSWGCCSNSVGGEKKEKRPSGWKSIKKSHDCCLHFSLRMCSASKNHMQKTPKNYSWILRTYLLYVFIFQDLQIQTHRCRSRQTSLILPPCISMRPIPLFCGDFVSFHFCALRLIFLLIYGPLQSCHSSAYIQIVSTNKSLISVGVPWGLNIIIPNEKKKKKKRKGSSKDKSGSYTATHPLISRTHLCTHTGTCLIYMLALRTSHITSIHQPRAVVTWTFTKTNAERREKGNLKLRSNIISKLLQQTTRSQAWNWEVIISNDLWQELLYLELRQSNGILGIKRL